MTTMFDVLVEWVTEYCQTEDCPNRAALDLPYCAHCFATKPAPTRIRNEQGSVATGCAVLGSLISIIIVGVFLALAVWVDPAHASQPRTEYVACSMADDPETVTDCVWDARHQGDGRGHSIYFGEGGRMYVIPHHVAHSLIHLTSDHGAYFECPTEDSKDCVWDARHRGNGMGQSFYTGSGRRPPQVWALPHHVAHFLLAR